MKDATAHTDSAGWNWDHSYARLPALFFARVAPESVAESRMIIFNHALGTELGLQAGYLASEEAAGFFTGNRLPEGAEPIAQAYAGHQYGRFTGLGDGRALLLGEHLSPDGKRWDIQLKGSGRTPYSRNGDGRAVVGPMLREYLISEAMQALGIPTTRSLAVAATGESVWRNEPSPGAVLTRVAASHIRIGTFEWAAAHEDKAALVALLRHTVARHYPGLEPGDARAFYRAAMERQLALVAEWMRVGFIHGVMNTDNVALSGETIDYGPCAFMDAYDPDAVFSSIDHGGRYSFANQPSIARWNMARLAEALLPLFSEERGEAIDFANEVLGSAEEYFQREWLGMMRRKTGLHTAEDGDMDLVEDLLDRMHQSGADFTNTFRALCGAGALEKCPFDQESLREWHGLWQARLARNGQAPEATLQVMRAANPAVIPRNHLVEDALASATSGDMKPFQNLLRILASPYEEPKEPGYTEAAPAGVPRHVTYCGT